MEVTDEKPTGFYIHTLATGADGRLRLLSPERITVPGETPQDAAATPTRVSDPEHRQRSGRGKR
jgi:hypothetical protein